MTACVLPQWALGVWGMTPWGGTDVATAGGPLPAFAPFDIYCVGPCGEISELLTHPEVSVEGIATQFPIDGPTLDQIFASGGSYPTGEAEIRIATDVPENWTLEFAVKFTSLPKDFSTLETSHAFLGAANPTSASAGLFFSRIGLLYTGSVHVTGLGALVVDTPLQPLPNSQLLVSEGEYWTIRICVSGQTGTTFLYVTRSMDLPTFGHQLRYVLPAIPSDTATVVPPSETLLLARGTAALPTVVQLQSICLGPGIVAPNLPPVADAGNDQALRTCSILQLDGSASSDPEGAALSYRWRLLDAPLGSQYLFDGVDGRTYPLPLPTGFTDRFYSPALGIDHALDALTPGDVLLVGGAPYVIVTTGTDGGGFYVRVDGYVLPDSLSVLTAFKVLRQRGLNTPTVMKPTFYPDVPGLYKFDLVVFDGGLFSLPAVVVANVLESFVARGVIPETRFLWDCLSDFWKLVEDRERLDVYFEGVAQVAAAELLTLWQVEYSKSLRDIQRTFQRKWLHYDLLLTEAQDQIEKTTVTAVLSGLFSLDIPTAGLGAVGGTHLDLQLATRAAPFTVSFPGVGAYTAVQLQVQLQAQLYGIDPRFTVAVVLSTDGTQARLRIGAPFAVSVLPSSTCPAFAPPAANSLLAGTGNAVGLRTYRVDAVLPPGLGEGDVLLLEGEGYRVARVLSDPSDPYPNQRLTLVDDLPTPAPTVWKIGGRIASPDLDFYAGLVTAGDVATVDVFNTTTREFVQVNVLVLGAAAALPGVLFVDATILAGFIIDPTYLVVFQSLLRKKYVPVDPLVVDVPYLQERIKPRSDEEVLRRNVDFFLETFRGIPCLRFVTAPAPDPDVWEHALPPDQLWAEYTFLDNRPTIEANFGLLAAFTLDDLAMLPGHLDYLSAVRGLWYTHLQGPTVFNIRAGTQILLGLPFAEEAGTIVEVRDDFSSTGGRILVRDLAAADIVRSYAFPAVLDLEVNPKTGTIYKVGDTVAQFAPLVTGVDVIDYVKDPKWFQGYMEQGVFFEIEKFFKFLVRVDSQAFSLSSLLFVQAFVRRIKPTYTFPLFVVRGTVGDTTVEVSDAFQAHVRLRIEEGLGGQSHGYDAPDPSGGGYQNQFDRRDSNTPPPTFPTAQVPIVWGFDKTTVRYPQSIISARVCTTLLAPAPLPVDSVFRFDRPSFIGEVAFFPGGNATLVPAGGYSVQDAYTMQSNETLTGIDLELSYADSGSPPNYVVDVKVNGVIADSLPVVIAGSSPMLTSKVTSIPVVIGDVVEAFIRPASGLATPVTWKSVSVTVGLGYMAALDATVPAGTYCVYKDL